MATGTVKRAARATTKKASKKKPGVKKAAAKKTAAKKAPAKKTAANKTATKKSSAKKTAAKKSPAKNATAEKSTATKAGTAKPKASSSAPVHRVSPAPDLDIDPEVLEFIAAVDRYRKDNARPFPTWSEVMHIVRGLGYHK